MRIRNADAIPPPAPAAPARLRCSPPKRRPATGAQPAVAHVAPPALLLACGNTLRQDDGVGWRVAEMAGQLFAPSRLRVISVHQFTPELAADVAEVDLALFVDACVSDEPGSIRVTELISSGSAGQPDSHRLEAEALICLAQSLCGRSPRHAFLLTIGACEFGFGEELSGALARAVPRAVRLVGNLLAAFAGSQ